MKVWKEEVFGPILPVMAFHSIEEAIELANDTIYGLEHTSLRMIHSTFHTLALGFQSGMVQLNNVNYCIPSDPFGGYKASGIGREHGKWGFMNLRILRCF